MPSDATFAEIKPRLDALKPRELTGLMHRLERYYRDRYISEECPQIDTPLPAATYATLSGKFIDENDWWPDGHVANATISVYSVDDNSLLASTSTDQNGYYSAAGLFRNREVRVVATPPVSAHCRRAEQTVQLVVDNVVKTVDFKDECKF
jgi:hypothetical protein